MATAVVIASPDLEPTMLPGGRRWKTDSIPLSVSKSLLANPPSIKHGSDVQSAISSAARAWEEVAAIKFLVSESHRESISRMRGSGDGTNLLTIAATPENIALFPDQHRSSPAFTRLFFSRSGSIVEADIVLNPFVNFSTDGTADTYDLQAVITHELGHVLGLSHSPSMSATMYERLSINREGSQRGLSGRTLSVTDISSIRDTYGPSEPSVNCCTSVLGAIDQPQDSAAIVWVEESPSGRLAAAVGAAGSKFTIGGFDAGKYRVLIQAGSNGPSIELFERVLDLPFQVKQVSLGNSALQPTPRLIGTGGELGTSPISLAKGMTHQIFVGGAGLDPASVSIGFSGESISVVDGSVFPMDYGRDLTAFAMSINISPNAPAGDYSLYVEAPAGTRRYLIGCISVY